MSEPYNFNLDHIYALLGAQSPQMMQQQPMPQAPRGPGLATPQRQGDPISALMGNPLFGAGMGLLSSASGGGNPYQAALAGMLGTSVFKRQQQEYDLKQRDMELQQQQQEQQAKLADSTRKNAIGMYNTMKAAFEKSDGIDPWESAQLARIQQVIETADPAAYNSALADFKPPEAYKPASSVGKAAADLQAGLITRQQFDQIVAGSGGPQTGPTEGMRNWGEVVRLGGEGWTPDQPYNEAQQKYINLANPSSLGYTSGSMWDKATANQRIDFVRDYPKAFTASNDAINTLLRLREKMETAPTGLGGNILALTDAELQDANAMLYDATLKKVGLLKSEGISLAPFTAEDVRIIQETQGTLTNQREANLSIIDRNIAAYQRVKSDLEGTEEFWKMGYNPMRQPQELAQYLMDRRRRLGLSTEAPSGPNQDQGGLTPEEEARLQELEAKRDAPQ